MGEGKDEPMSTNLYYENSKLTKDNKENVIGGKGCSPTTFTLNNSNG